MKQRSFFSKPKTDTVTPSAKPCSVKPCTLGPVNPRFTEPFAHKGKLSEEDVKVYERIQRSRLCILIWSKLYYDFNINLVSDDVFDRVGRELQHLQSQYPEISKIVAYAKEFEDWEGGTGFHLPLRDPWVCSKAQQILDIIDRRNVK